MYYSAIHSLLLYVSSANLIKIRSAYSNSWIKVSLFVDKREIISQKINKYTVIDVI